MEALKEQEPINRIASRYEVLPTQVSAWKSQLLKRLPETFESDNKRSRTETDWEEHEARLFQKIGQLEVELDWLKKNLSSCIAEKRRMIEPQKGKITVKRQCELLGLARSTGYYRPRGESAENLAIMRWMDEIYTEHPFYGVRQLTRVLRREGRRVNPKRVRRLMRLMGLEAQCPRPNLSKPAPGHKVYPYLMKALKLDGANQAWSADITYIRLEGGFVYLVAIMDWFSRKVIAWELSNTFDTAFCLKCLKRAVKTHGAPAVINTDQASQFTSEGWTSQLERLGVTICMDGRGRALDNVFIERLWRSVKYEQVYQREYGSMLQARGYLDTYFEFYNNRRPHSSLNDRTPCEAHEGVERKRAA